MDIKSTITKYACILCSLYLLASCQKDVSSINAPVHKQTIPPSANNVMAIHPSAYPRAFQRFYERAQQGDPVAQNNVGRMYADGRGVPVDSQQALIWFNKSASQGNVDAMLNLGACYLFGRGVSTDDKMACKFFKASMDKGSLEGKSFYSKYCN